MSYVLLRIGGRNENYGYAHKEFLVESENDLENIDTHGLAPGSLAHTAGFKSVWELGIDGTWVKGGDEDG